MKADLQLPSVARFYFGSVIAAGLAVTLLSAWQLFTDPAPSEWLILAALTALTGSFTVKIPKVSARISVSDAFVFASVLLFGPPTATVIVALDCLVETFWGRRSLLKSFFNLSATAFAIWIAAHSFYWLSGLQSPGREFVLTQLFWPLFTLAAVYFVANSWLVAIALAFERRSRAWPIWREHFPWFSLNYLGGVSVAALLVAYTSSVDLAAVGIILPLLVISYLTHRASLGRVQDAQRHVDQVNQLYMSTIEALAMAVDAKDQITHGHIRRVQVYATQLAHRLGVTEERQLKAIEAAALLHDLGKLAIPEHILNKPHKLTPTEFDKMKRHSNIGADLLSSIKFPYPVIPIVRHHHEHWDGSGYPFGISGPDIPLGARILSVVDCFDALTSDRPYRPRLSAEEAFTVLRERRGTSYDPLVVDTFIRAYPEIAPAAIQAGQEARSIVDMTGFQPALGQEGATSLNQIRANASEATILDTYAKSLAKAMSLADAVSLSAQCLRQLTPATVYALFRYDPTRDLLVCENAIGDEHRFLDRLVIKLGERITGWCGANRRTSINADASLDLAQIADFFAPRLRCAASVPLVRNDRLIAVLTTYATRDSAFGDSHRYVLEQVASGLLDRMTSLETSSSTIVSFRTS